MDVKVNSTLTCIYLKRLTYLIGINHFDQRKEKTIEFFE